MACLAFRVLSSMPRTTQQGAVVCVFYANTWETEARGLGIPGCPPFCRKSEIGLSYALK